MPLFFYEECNVLIKISNNNVEQSNKSEKAVKIVYCLYRVSTKNQIEENDIPMQKMACHQFAETHTGWVIRKELYELGVSSYKVAAADRDQIQELKACAERKEFDVLLVFMFDRLGRRDDETPFVLRWFYENGIEIWSVKEGQKVFDSSTDDMLNYMYFWAAKAESLKTSMRVRTKLRQMVSEGKYTGGVAPFGYKLVRSGERNHKGRKTMKHKIVSEEAEIVRMIFHDTAVYGIGTFTIAEKINEMGFRTHKGAKFQSVSINRILRNPIYCGFYYRGGVLSPRLEELQIIDDSLYNEAQRVLDDRSAYSMERNTFNNNNSPHLLSGNIYCKCCGTKMCATSNRYYYRAADGSLHWSKRSRYICAGRVLARSNCDGQGTFTSKYVDSYVEDYLSDCLNSVIHDDIEFTLEKKYNKTLDALKSKIQKFELEKEIHSVRIKSLYNQVADSLLGNGIYNPELISESISNEKDELSIVENKLSLLYAEINDTDTLKNSLKLRFKELCNLLQSFENSTLDRRREIVNKLISKVVVGKGIGERTNYNINVQLSDWYADLI